MIRLTIFLLSLVFLITFSAQKGSIYDIRTGISQPDGTMGVYQSSERKTPQWYMGGEPPGVVAEVFGGEVLRNTINVAITPGGSELFFTSDSDGNGKGDINVMYCFDGKWTDPGQATFNSLYNDNDIAISPDGRIAYFRSWRPFAGKSEKESASYIWFTERTDTTWSDPQPLLIAGDYLQAGYPAPDSAGNLYFTKVMDRESGYGDIFCIERRDSAYLEMANQGIDPGNQYNEGDICVAPDGRFIIVACWERPDLQGGGRSDLYISFRKEDGKWTELLNMGPEINSSQMENSPALSPDGKFLFFNRYDGVESYTYWISTKIINHIRMRAEH